MSTNGSNGAPAHGVGEVASRFGVAVSTLYWWEKEGLLAPARHAGRRVYGAADLRRIALIQLMQGTAMMSLPDIAALIAGGRDDQDWHTSAERRLADCEEQLTRLNRARTYLRHLLTCPSTHPVDQCPYLADEIDHILTATAWTRSPPVHRLVLVKAATTVISTGREPAPRRTGAPDRWAETGS
ncbi:MerR family transcriptional regulator [Streptomyces niveiscabiei]|uniref:MerR family transcriptional regulator n=1 Tax=Streptomyces TaxID=1883 RepID=UPI0006EBBC1F|nr:MULTISPECIES: MerR family transcriptional regulator [Streptomyces]